jgi:hypothetical protein
VIGGQLSVASWKQIIDPLPLTQKKAAFTKRRKDAKIFQSVSSAMPFT